VTGGTARVIVPHRWLQSARTSAERSGPAWPSEHACSTAFC
jgi:hypothetical protein